MNKKLKKQLKRLRQAYQVFKHGYIFTETEVMITRPQPHRKYSLLLFITFNLGGEDFCIKRDIQREDLKRLLCEEFSKEGYLELWPMK